MVITETLIEIIQRTMGTKGSVEDTEEALLDIRDTARQALSGEGVSVVLEGESGCYCCGVEFPGDPPQVCLNCGRPVIFVEA